LPHFLSSLYLLSSLIQNGFEFLTIRGGEVSS
jgi:hypothetical protein